MSFDIHKKLRESLPTLRKPHYTASHLAVLEGFAYRINDKSGVCFPSMETIAEESWISERHARKIVRQLEEDGLVQVISSPRRSNRYRLTIPECVAPSAGSHILPGDSVTFSGASLMLKGENQPSSEGAKQGLGTVEGNSKAAQTTSEARLTYNSNPLSNEVRDGDFKLINDRSPFGAHKTEIQTDESVQSWNKESKAVQEAVAFHQKLMKRLNRKEQKASGKDLKSIEEAIQQYGSVELEQILAWVYNQKNDFWRKKLKEAGYPCSYFVRSLPTMIRQAADIEEWRVVAGLKTQHTGKKQYSLRPKSAAVKVAEPQFTPAPVSRPQDCDFSSFEIEAEEEFN